MQKTDYNCSQRLRDSFYGLFQLTVFFHPLHFSSQWHNESCDLSELTLPTPLTADPNK